MDTLPANIPGLIWAYRFPAGSKTAIRLENSAQMVTALNPVIGYEQAALVAKKVNKEGKSVPDAVIELGIKDHQGNLLTRESLVTILSPEAMTEPPKA